MTAEQYPFEFDVCGGCEKTYRRPTPEMVESLAVKPVMRVVYVAGGHQPRLTLKAAYKQAPMIRVRKRYPCECDSDVGYHCTAHRSDHDDSGWFAKLEDRLARWLVWHDRETRKRGRSPFADCTLRAAPKPKRPPQGHGPYVCPGCHAVGAGPCAPGCQESPF